MENNIIFFLPSPSSSLSSVYAVDINYARVNRQHINIFHGVTGAKTRSRKWYTNCCIAVVRIIKYINIICMYTTKSFPYYIILHGAALVVTVQWWQCNGRTLLSLRVAFYSVFIAIIIINIIFSKCFFPVLDRPYLLKSSAASNSRPTVYNNIVHKQWPRPYYYYGSACEYRAWGGWEKKLVSIYYI